MSRVSGMTLQMCWRPWDHVAEGTQEVTQDNLSLPVSQAGVQNNSDLNTPGSPRALLLESDLAMPFLPLLFVLPKSWEGSGLSQLSLSKVYKTQVGKRGWYQDKSAKRLLLHLQKENHPFSWEKQCFPPIYPKSTSTQPSPCWCGRKGPCEAGWALILQPPGTHFPKELRDCRAGGARFSNRLLVSTDRLATAMELVFGVSSIILQLKIIMICYLFVSQKENMSWFPPTRNTTPLIHLYLHIGMKGPGFQRWFKFWK